ncbi:MAG TPA: hypothetical protein VG127_09550 [Rubrobacteraceae bacterium]|jgi:hypothetical protein|nr:hypothetical protein [Rubrobacteraceae bacterium]
MEHKAFRTMRVVRVPVGGLSRSAGWLPNRGVLLKERSDDSQENREVET